MENGSNIENSNLSKKEEKIYNINKKIEVMKSNYLTNNIS
jgi:hypothetical protein